MPRMTTLGYFIKNAEEGGSAPALYYFDEVITFGELLELSLRMAAALRDIGVRSGERVALYLQNVPQFPLAVFASWMIGATVVPLNPMFTGRELEYHLNDSGATVLVSLSSLYEKHARGVIEGTGVKHVFTTSAMDFLRGGVPEALVRWGETRRVFGETMDLLETLRRYEGSGLGGPPTIPSHEETAYITYTSGTTGAPKGAMNTHGNVVYNACAFKALCQLGKGDVIVGIAPLFAITGTVAYVATSALVGIPIILSYRFDAGEVLRLIEKWRGSFTVAPITAFIALMNHPDAASRDISCFRKIWSGGAPTPPSVVEEFERRTGLYIRNVWGMSETSSPSIIVPADARAPIDRVFGTLSIGIPIPGSEARVVDPEGGGRELGPNEPGELIVRGPYVMRGYWGKPSETSRALRDGWLYTGDIAMRDEDGWLYIIDRKKDVIIASGFKVWPREVEDVLYRHPGVYECAVVGVPDPYRGETVKAYVSLRDEYRGKVAPGELIELCRRYLAAYKVPRVIEIVDEIPKTPTGKILRRAFRQGA